MDTFILDTDKHNCFLCSGPCPSVKRESDTSSSATYSIQYLSRYLKMDMRKVFNEEGPIVPELLAKVEKAKLKVELCEKCRSLNKTFSKLYRKLEKIDLEVKSCVSLIHKKFLKAQKTPTSNEKDDFDGRTQIVKNLRTDGMEKCVGKLSKVSPRLRVQMMTTKQVEEERQKMLLTGRQNKFEVTEAEQTSDFMTNYNADGYMDYSAGIESEPFEQSSNYADHHVHAEEEYPAAQGMENVKEGSGKIVPVSTSSTETVSVWPQSKRAEKMYTLNTVTGKYKCILCSSEFNSTNGCYHHYNSVHLKTKFKCNLCGKEFTHRHTFQRHHKSVHMGVKFRCLGCNKVFSYKTALTTHQQKTGCGAGSPK